ncbi:unnamed protein product [Thlaspi arvense]|uniref:DNA topoisomerase 2 n=1 Tax=Thlaspi arvense TaxID=13288 RepID=A0AAU9T070_THLAR|nr:unnamed protein product [Thlaspi arvense]
MYGGTVRRVSVSVEMEDNNPKNDLYKESFYSGGLSQYISWLNVDKKPLHDVLTFRKEINGITMDIALQWFVDGYADTMLGFANSIRSIDGGTHIDGAKASITRTLNSLAKKSKVVKDEDITFSGEHVREGLTCIVSVIVPNPEFEGQTQTRLGNPYVREIVDQSVEEYLTEYFELHPHVLESIISKSLNAYKTALAIKRAREVIRSESVATPCTIPEKPCTIPEKLTNCSSAKSGETWGKAVNSDSPVLFHGLWPVVNLGDSSGGAAKQGPDRRFQPKGIVSVALTVISISCQSKRTREQPRRDCAASRAPGKSFENTSDSSFEKKRQKLKSSVPSSRPCFSSRQTAEASNPPNRKGAKILKRAASGSNITKNVVPIGPGFQAEIPIWIAPTKKGKFYGSPGDSDTLRWLGTGVWPTYSLKKKAYCKKVGQGRTDSCSCASPRSTGCVKQHIREEGELLEKEIGRAFYAWKFDEMGEVGAKSWTAKEEQRFEALVKSNPMSSSKGFWGLASKAFPR